MFCDLPESLNPEGEGWDASVVAEMREADQPRRPALRPEEHIEMTNKGTNGQLSKLIGPKIIHVPRYVMPTPDQKKIYEEVNLATRDCAFHFLETHGNQRVKRFRKNVEESYGTRTLLGEKLSMFNWNTWAQLLVLIVRAYLKSDEVHPVFREAAAEHQRPVARVQAKAAREQRVPHVPGNSEEASESRETPRRRVRFAAHVCPRDRRRRDLDNLFRLSGEKRGFWG